jgi:alpha-tubulin suppressor-like RCC1 family protein
MFTFAMLGSGAALIPACNGNGGAEESVFRSVKLQLRFHLPATENAANAPFRALASKDGDLRGAGEFSQVERIQVDVTDADTEQLFLNNLEFVRGADDLWTATIAALPANRTFRFFAEAFDANGTRLFSGEVEISLTADNQVIEIPLAPEQDGDEFDLPHMARISYQNVIATGQSMPVVFTVEGEAGTSIDVTVSTETGSLPFVPSQRSVTLNSSVADLVATYTAPEVTTETEFSYHVTLAAELAQSSLAVDTEFSIRVVPRTTVVDDIQPVILLSPVILSLDGALQRGPDSQYFTPDDQVRLAAAVSDDGPQSELEYAWSFTPSPGTDPASFANQGQGNPGVLQAYQPALQGQISLAVTDGGGSTTTLFYNINPNQFADAYDDSDIVQMVTGDSHTCIMTTAGRVRCWGQNSFGQLGYGNTTTIGDDPARQPSMAGDVPLPASDPAAQITAGANHTCALLQSGMAYCWGRNDSGQLGYSSTAHVGDDESVTSAGFINAGGLLSTIAAGGNHTCAVLSESGEVRCWGQNDHGQLGRGDTESFSDSADEPTSAATSVSLGAVRATSLALGASHSCAMLADASVRCWGSNSAGELGSGSTSDDIGDEPADAISAVLLGGTARQIEAGQSHTCAVMTSGSVRCWGDDSNGQLGNGAASTPVTDPGAQGDLSIGGEVASIGLGSQHTCALLINGQAKCWGSDSSGQLGYGDTTDRAAPPAESIQLGASSAFLISGGQSHSCAVRSNGSVRCWGRGEEGQLGQGSTAAILDPASSSDIQLFTP